MAVVVSVAGALDVSGMAVSSAAPLNPAVKVSPLIVPGSEVTVEGLLLNPTRIGLYDTLLEMGADIAIVNRRMIAVPEKLRARCNQIGF